MFWIIAIFAGIVSVAGFLLIPPPPPKPDGWVRPTVDWIGGATITIALVMLLFALTEGNVVGWRTPWIGVLLGISIILVAIFVVWQHFLETKTTKNPLMKVSIFKSMRFSAAMLIMFFVVADLLEHRDPR